LKVTKAITSAKSEDIREFDMPKAFRRDGNVVREDAFGVKFGDYWLVVCVEERYTIRYPFVVFKRNKPLFYVADDIRLYNSIENKYFKLKEKGERKELNREANVLIKLLDKTL
jgi:hypothetical protein